ncbi:hypothetical protein [Nocardia carnea]|uniref:hypothetical protein n=1 Tax=Nocardia carnea TaxID=37328 RepID=UPI0024559F34|nr:hypothetical protein [Nocardia carnea]
MPDPIDCTVQPGDLYRDSRNTNIRTLRVDTIDGDRVVCTVIRQEYDGEITTPMRVTPMSIKRLTSRSFIRIEPGA